MIEPRVIGLIGQSLFEPGMLRGLALTVLINRENKAFYPFMTLPGTQFQASQRVNTFFQPINSDQVNRRILYSDSINNTAPKMIYKLEFGDVLFQKPEFKIIRDVLSGFTNIINIIGLGSAPVIQTMQSIQEGLYPGNESTWAVIDYMGHYWPRVAFESANFTIENLVSDGIVRNFRLDLTVMNIQDVDMSQFYPLDSPQQSAIPQSGGAK